MDYTRRLVECGIPQMTAECIVADFERRGSVLLLMVYVGLTEVLTE